MNEPAEQTQESIMTIDSRDVVEMLRMPHKKLVRDITGYLGVISASSNLSLRDFFIRSSYEDAQGKRRKCYLVTRKGCELISHTLTGAKEVQFSAYYIDRFHDMEEEERKREEEERRREAESQKYNVPSTFSEALRLAANLAEEIERLTGQEIGFVTRETK